MASATVLQVLALSTNLLILKDCLAVAQRRIDEGATPLEPGIVQDAREIARRLRIKINQFQSLT